MPKSSFSNSRKVGRRHGISRVCLNKPNDANETTQITNNHHLLPTNSKQLPRGNRGSPIQGKRSATKLKARQGSPKMLRIQPKLAKRCQKSRKRLPNKQQATTNKRRPKHDQHVFQTEQTVQKDRNSHQARPATSRLTKGRAKVCQIDPKAPQGPKGHSSHSQGFPKGGQGGPRLTSKILCHANQIPSKTAAHRSTTKGMTKSAARRQTKPKRPQNQAAPRQKTPNLAN